ncbi:MAG: tetratricopeptide repeat protein [Burkholderiales bacterium]
MSGKPLQDIVARGLDLYRAGKLAEAEALYRQVLETEPRHAGALTMLGTIQAQRGSLAEAARLFETSLEADPHQSNALYNYGIVLAELKRFEEALARYDGAIALKPDNPVILNNRGNALAELKRFDEALASYDRALALKRDYADAFLNRGMVLLRLNRHEEALASCDRALAITPDDSDALFHRANSLTELNRLGEAVESYDRVIALTPGNALAFNNRGNALADLCRQKEALASYDRALALKADYLDALFNRGVLLRELRRHEESLASFQAAAAIQSDADRELPSLRGYIACARLHLCDWSSCEAAIDEVVKLCLAGKKVVVPFNSYMLKDSPALHYQCARARALDKHPISPHPVWRGERYPHDRIRLTYASFDFREHVVARQVAGVIENHDRERFETTALSLSPGAPDAMQDRLRSAFGRFIDVGNRSDLEVARLLRELETDILVDLTGYTRGGRTGIFACRPAPIQVNWLGCPGTLGVEYFDYIIGDGIVTPQEHQAHYAEKVAGLPDCYLPQDAKRPAAGRMPSRGEAGLPDTGFVFCSFNASYKFRPALFDVWMRLLLRFEGSVLWLRVGNSTAADHLRSEAAARGVHPERLVFAPHVERMEDHLARQGLADLFLDTLPYNAHATASDALWAGLPVLTCLGGAFPGRVGASLLTAVGLPELVTQSLEEYEALADLLVREPGRLRQIKDKLARNRGTRPLFDTTRFTRHLEAAYEQMWRVHQRGEAPRHFSVTPLSGAQAGVVSGSH